MSISFCLNLCLIFVFQEAPAKEPSPAICLKRYIIDIGNLEPVYFVNQRIVENAGLGPAVLEEFEKRMGCKTVRYSRTIPSSINNMRSNRTDIYLFAAENPRFSEAADFVEAYRNHPEIIVRNSIFKQGQSLEYYIKKTNAKIAIFLGSLKVLTPEQEKKLIAQGRIVSAPTPNVAYSLFKKKKVDIVLTESMINRHQITKLSLDKEVNIVIDETKTYSVGYYLSKKRLSAEEKIRIAEVFESLRKDGTLKGILAKYMGEELAKFKTEF